MAPRLLQLVDHADRIVTRAAANHYGATCGALIAYVVASNGVGRVPGDDHRLFALKLFSAGTAIGSAEHYHADIALPLLARALGATSPRAFAALCLSILLATLAGIAWRLRSLVGATTAVLIFALILAHPVVIVLLSWIGEPDVLTFATTAVVLFAAAPAAIAAAACLGAMSHTLALCSLPMVLALRLAAGERMTARQFIALVSGLVVGVLAVRAFLAVMHVPAASRLDVFSQIGFSYWIKQNVGTLPFAVWSLHGGVWFALMACAYLRWHADRLYVLVCGGLMVAAYLLAFVALDTTRVFALLAWAPAAHLLLTTSDRTLSAALSEEGASLRRALVILAFVALVTPRIFVWEGAVVASPFRNVVVRLYHAAMVDNVRDESR